MLSDQKPLLMRMHIRTIKIVTCCAAVALTFILFQNATVSSTDQDTLDLVYNYDLDENLTEITDIVNPSQTQRYSYDGLSRLSSSSFGGSLAYSATGDLLAYTEVGKAPKAMAFSGQSQLAVGSAFDSEGNMISDERFSYTYRGDSLVAVAGASGVVANYAYDASGLRTRKILANGRSTYYLYVGNQLMFEASTGAGVAPVTKEFFYSGESLLATRNVTSCTGSCVPTIKYEYYHSDSLRSTLAVSREDGSLIRERYNSYGSHLNTASTGSKNVSFDQAATVRFAGHTTDDETGLTYMGARYYDPTVGRFMALDPERFEDSNVQSFNRFAYANNNPTRYIDPDGRVAVNVSRSSDLLNSQSGSMAKRVVVADGATASQAGKVSKPVVGENSKASVGRQITRVVNKYQRANSRNNGELVTKIDRGSLGKVKQNIEKSNRGPIRVRTPVQGGVRG